MVPHFQYLSEREGGREGGRYALQQFLFYQVRGKIINQKKRVMDNENIEKETTILLMERK